jgi:hypothetical protein
VQSQFASFGGPHADCCCASVTARIARSITGRSPSFGYAVTKTSLARWLTTRVEPPGGIETP